MQRNANNLIGYNLDATDGEIGKVEDFYFDDQTWTIRYLIVKTGTWLSGRDVLISPHALLKHSWESGIFPVNLTREQVHNSPAIDTHKPVSRQHEEQLVDYYAWQSYWNTAFIPGHVWGVIPSTPVIDPDLTRAPETTKKPTEDPHLRSCHKITGYHLHATDGNIGHVNDFIVDDQTWQNILPRRPHAPLDRRQKCPRSYPPCHSSRMGKRKSHRRHNRRIHKK